MPKFSLWLPVGNVLPKQSKCGSEAHGSSAAGGNPSIAHPSIVMETGHAPGVEGGHAGLSGAQ